MLCWMSIDVIGFYNKYIGLILNCDAWDFRVLVLNVV